MKIYYFGELIEIDGRKVANNQLNSETKTTEQTRLNFDLTESDEEPKKTGLPSVGDILKEIDLSLDAYRPFQKVLQ